MGKVISFELKKLLSRIGIYLLVIFMAALLVASVFIYDPIERQSSTLSLQGDSISEMYDNFISSGIKDSYDEIVVNVANTANSYNFESSDYNIYNNSQTITNLFNEFDKVCLQYRDMNGSNEEYNILLSTINSHFDSLQTALNDTLTYTKDGSGYYILTTNNNYLDLISVLEKIDINFSSPANHKNAANLYFDEYRNQLYNCLQNLIYPNLNDVSNKFIEGGGYHSVISLRMEEIAQKMHILNQSAIATPILQTDENAMEELNTLYNRYANSAIVFEQAFKSSICVQALSQVESKLQRSNLLGYADVSLYEQEELVVEYQYYIEHNSNPKDYANSFSITHTSNYEANAYDFTFFTMSIFSVVVIIFAIYLSAHSISGEINNGYMRFTAIRPVKRGSLFFGKYMAIAIISFILLAFGTITSFIVGAIQYGVNSANILMIINGSSVIVAHPIVVLLIFILSLMIMVLLYSAITIMLSSCIKSELLTMILSLVFYCINMILPLFFGANSWLKFYPFANINLFAYFGANRMTTDSVLSRLFNNVVYSGMNIWISLVYVIGITALVLLIGKTVFKKRDL